jgi:NADH dehydrogenase
VQQSDRTENVIIDAIGPETFTYRELAKTIGKLIGCSRPVVSVPPWLGYAVGSVIGRLVGDVTITRDEIEGLMADLLFTTSPPAGKTKLTDWTREHADTLGYRYTSEVARRIDRKSDYSKL